VAGLSPSAAVAASVIAPPDGRSAATAAASCWDIKQLNAAAPNGIYWLTTPTLGAPDQFYCDQTTSGGGWVLIGRGRDGWSESQEGRGTPAGVRTTITGTAAFTPQQLSSATVGALLNGSAVKSLPDGVRLRRATNVEGTSWQESTFLFSSPRTDWSWAFNNEQRTGSWNIGGATGSGGQTMAFGSGTGLNRIETATTAAQGWRTGFGFGTSSRGTSSATSFLWAPSTTAGNPRPFSQVFLRPKLMSSAIFSAIPTAGTPAVAQAAVANSFAVPTTWGVSGLGAGPNTVEGSNEVSAFAESKGIVYVGGNFVSVQKTAAGGSAVTQSYLAAFSVSTGEWISSFRPTFDKQVKALAVLPDGSIAVGGYFSTVNGQSRPGLVALNPTTGATNTAFSTKLYSALSGGVPIVRALDVQGGWLYLGGTFTHVSGGTQTSQVYLRGGARVAVGNGTPDSSWNPEFNGSVVSLDASARGDRTYFAGYFTASKTTPALKRAALTTSTAAVIPWSIAFSSPPDSYQQAVKEVGDKVWIGGAQHMLFSYARATMAVSSTNITKSGGDFQAISTDGTVVYAGCHCFYTSYSDAKSWPDMKQAWTQASKISSAGAWDSASGKRMPQFSPIVSQRAGAGSWALFNDSTGKTWFGGDYSGSVKAGFVTQWSGGFVRFDRNDSAAPTAPSGLVAGSVSTGDSLRWSGSTDDRGAVTYQVLRNDRVIATTTSTSLVVTAAPTGTKYFVRAADSAGNWSASTPAALVSANAPVPDAVPAPAPAALITAGSSWGYYFGSTAPNAAWKDPGFSPVGWSTGTAPIGWGQSRLGTTLSNATPRPLVSYYRKTIDIASVAAINSVLLTTRADDGIVVYVNGTEVARKNLNPGTVGFDTYANAAVSASAAVANPVTVTVPATLWRTGSNVITAEVHSNYRSTPSASFELTAAAQ
jgi:hypothetical protein